MISSEQQLRAAAERLGADVEDLRTLFPTLVNLSTSPDKFDSDVSTASTSLLVQNVSINKALDESRFAICETAFGSSPSHGTSFSRGYSTPVSPALLSPTHHADSNSAASASSSAAAVHVPNSSKTKSEILTVSCEDAVSSEDDSVSTPLRDTKVLRNVAKVSQGSILHESGKESSSQSGNPTHPLSKSPSQLPPTTPLGSILSFARGQQLCLVDVSHLDEGNALRKMRSLSIIPGCDKYGACCLFNYIGALLKAHLNLVQNLSKGQSGLTIANVDDLHCEIADTLWRTIFSDYIQPTPEGEGPAEDCPPIIRKSMDLLQFTYRLVDQMSGAGDSLTRGFLEGLYASDTPKLVASLTTKLLSSWVDVWRNVTSLQQQSLLLEWCIRLLIDFVVYELSPVSQVGHMKDVSPDAFVVFNLGKDGLPPLSTVVDYCFQFVSSHQVGKECRVSLCELVKAYVIWSSCPRPGGSAQAKLWTETWEPKKDYLDSLVGKEAFWTIVVQSALQHVKKLPPLSDSCFDYTFLSSLVSLSAAKRALFDDRQDKYKWMLLNLMIRSLELISRDPLSSFVEAEECRSLFPDIRTSIDFTHGLITSAAVQREILSADPATKGRFLSSLESLIANSAKVVFYSPSVGEALEYAQKGPFAKIAATDLSAYEADAECEDSRTETKKGNEQMKGVAHFLAREKAVAFAAKLIGCLGKSVENGSWDMSQMNTIKALLHARINSSRARHRFWNDVYKIYRGVEKKIGTQVLLSTLERNSFAMVVEIVRKHAACDSTDRNTGLPAQENSVESRVIPTASATREIEASLPPVWDISELQHCVCNAAGYTDFDNDHDVVMFMKDALIDTGQQMLARYDPDSPFTVKWVRLQKRNAYIGGARELLEKSDRTVGQLCSCVPGYPKENGNGHENRVACSNDLCENRHMKIECVPGKCGAGSYCMNQRMQSLDYAKFKMVPFPGKGVGIVADEDIPEGTLVGEYQGEIVTMDEYERRVQEYEGERHFYFMTLTNKLVIDASRRSQATRFLNHSCDPNSETQKWNADGEPRVGIFAKRAISKGEEITFDYGARSLTQYSARCLCGAKNCRGLLAVRKEEAGTPKEVSRERSANDYVRTESPSRGQRMCLEDRRSSVVKEKIETAKRYLREADVLSRKAEETPSFQRDHSFSDEMREKLNLWKASLSRRAGITVIPEKASEESVLEVGFPRIPRRSTILPQKDKHATRKGHDEKTEGTDSSRRISASREIEPLPVAQNVRSSAANHKATSAGRWALFEETCAGKLGDSQAPLKRRTEGESIRRLSKVPRAGFLPTTSKLKKQPRRPKIAKRKRTREQDGNDSMGDYSTASEAEPVLEEPITSPSRLPDGNGACSDDEFVAAPPVESIRFSPTGRRWKHSDHERRVYDERRMSPSEYGRAAEPARDGRRSRLGSSHRPAWIKTEANLQSGVRSGYGVQSPRTYERFRPMKADRRDVVAHGTDASGPMTDRRRYVGYRNDLSPWKKRYRQSDSRKLDNRRDGRALEEISDYKRHPRPLARRANSAFLTSRPGYSEAAEASALPNAKESIQNDTISPARDEDEDQDWTRMAVEDVDRPMSTKLGQGNSDFRLCRRGDADRRAKKQKEGTGRSFFDDNHVKLNKPHQERPEARFPRVVPSGSVESLECRDRDNQRFTYHAEKEARWVPPQGDRDTAGLDLRNILTRRSQKKNP